MMMQKIAAQHRWIITGAAFICWLAQVGASFNVTRLGITMLLLMMYGVLAAMYMIEQGKIGKFTQGLMLIYLAVAVVLLMPVLVGIYLGI